MSCPAQGEELLLLYAIDALDASEREAVRAHLASGCPRCAALLAEAQATWSLVGLSAADASVRVPGRAKAELDVRIEGAADGVGLDEREGLRTAGRVTWAGGDEVAAYVGGGRTDGRRAGRVGSGGRQGERRWGGLVAAACVGAAITVGVAFLTWGSEARRLRTQTDGLLSEISAVRGAQRLAEEQLAEASEQRDELASSLEELRGRLDDTLQRLAKAEQEVSQLTSELTEVRERRQVAEDLVVALREELSATQKLAEMLYSKRLLTLELTGQDPTPEARARLLVDLQNKVWKLYVSDLPRLDGRVYEFWLITADGRKVPMGDFVVDAEGRGELTGVVPDPLPPLAAAAVSDEPGPGAKEPTGALHMVGRFQ
ncbi:MAG: anti-sigma factor domain-containing protein [Tepidisphaerales bacterium]